LLHESSILHKLKMPMHGTSVHNSYLQHTQACKHPAGH